ncbi:MAG: N-6 DNA methylase [Acidimicrobiia bacterium]
MTDRLDSRSERKERGAFFTPATIANFLARGAIGDNNRATVLDPTCGDGAFLLSAASHLRQLGASRTQIRKQVYGVDIHSPTLDQAASTLAEHTLNATLHQSDFFEMRSPDQLGAPLPLMDAVIGNPPFVRYQLHTGRARKVAAAAALRQGVRLSGLASSWAATLVHAASFLKPEGRLGMVLPAELLQVHYAEPIRRWLRTRFAAVHLVFFERLQFEDATENVVLLLARGSGGCDAFSLYFVQDAADLAELQLFDEFAVTPASEGKWTDLLLSIQQRQRFRKVEDEHFTALGELGRVSLGTVTGSNAFFAIPDHVVAQYDLKPEHLTAICPPGSRHMRGSRFTRSDWNALRRDEASVWLLTPNPSDRSAGLRRYIRHGESEKVHEAYKCQVRDPWWVPPAVSSPDLFFTYMSHRFPRLVANTAGASFVNSMHGVWLSSSAPAWVRSALPLVSINSVTMLGAEVYGRSYGGGVLKLEPREAARLPVPSLDVLHDVWDRLRPDRAHLERELRAGRWTTVLAQVDRVLLRDALGLSHAEAETIHEGARYLRERRLNRR